MENFFSRDDCVLIFKSFSYVKNTVSSSSELYLFLNLCFSAHVSQIAAHDWIRADCNSNKCQVCHKKIKTLAGRRCVWCQEMVRTVFVSADINELIRSEILEGC